MMNARPITAEGGCLCGAVRYRVESPLSDVAYCHCRICQRSSGAPALPWASVPADRFGYIRGAPALYRSSANGIREFCATCGTPLVFRKSADAPHVDFTTVSLDDPAALPPTYHIWRMSRIGWFETSDTFPRFDDQGPDIF